MNNNNIACFDVYYYESYAKACCIVFENEPIEKVISEYYEIIKPVNEYIPGEFYKRELPCLLKLYGSIKEDIDLIIVDSFVLLGDGKKGLGGYLFEALDKKIPVIGVAKTFFKGCDDYIEVYRGKSNKPLYISSLGIDLNHSAELVKNLDGENRMPTVLKRVDQLTRVKVEAL
jgi:deoxyribonuclease V